ncbi:MAG: hypothetical protein ACI9DC_000380 [Gammaproteobacteria bacterium]|jgi:hypothetical protein
MTANLDQSRNAGRATTLFYAEPPHDLNLKIICGQPFLGSCVRLFKSLEVAHIGDVQLAKCLAPQVDRHCH